MKKINKISYIILMCCMPLLTVAQHSPKIDSLDMESAHQATENRLLEQQDRLQMDSMIKIRLLKDLQLAVGDRQKTKELEEKLRLRAITDSIHKAEQLSQISELKKSARGYPVAPFKDTLFYIYTNIGSFNAQERATAISTRIFQLYKSPLYNADSLQIIQNENNANIIYNKELVVLAVTTIDGLLAGQDNRQLASEYMAKIKTSIYLEKKENSLMNWLKRFGLVALVILILCVLIYLINRLFRRLTEFLHLQGSKHVKGIIIKNIKILTAEKELQLILKIKNVIRALVILVTVYLSLPLLFSLFPETRTWTNTLLGWILTPAKATFYGFISFLPNLFSILVIYFVFRYLIKAIKYFVDEIEKGNISLNGFHADWAQPTFNIVKFLLYAFMIVLMFPFLPGSHSTAFRGVSVFIGILLSLGSSSAISNMIAGLVITYMRPFKIGDRIKIGDVTGDVFEKTMLVTRIRTIKNEDITVPNATVLSSSTINYSNNTKPTDKGLILHTTVTIGYDVPWKNMHEALINAALKTALLLKDPKPFVLQTSLDDFYISYQINAYTKAANSQATIYSDLHQNIQDCCNEAGIEIMSPHYFAARDGNPTTIPGDYLPKDYKAPGFSVNINTG